MNWEEGYKVFDEPMLYAIFVEYYLRKRVS